MARTTAEAGRPYHVVHFDGHGAFLDASQVDDTVAVSALKFGAAVRDGRHGFLVFEEPSVTSRQRLVDGPTLGGLLVETRVPVLVLNACRSAYVEAPAAPDPTAGVHERIRAYGSLAAEVADQGVPGVAAMRYSVYVDTAARFVEDFYERLSAVRSLGMAVSAARKALADDPNRQVGATPVALQDWVVPTVYEPVELTLRAPTADAPPVSEPSLDVPDAPDIGFFGRDDALLALDRAFDTDRIVLLHALAGAGKSTTAAEFARWYTATGGVAGVLWTSFEHHTPLERVLNVAGDMFAPLLEANDIHWAAITDPAQRRSLILQVLAAVPVPVLWVWDNVEPVAGFPAGTPSAWTPEEQAELREFLRDLQKTTRAKVLLTSRRDEHAWLGALARRVGLAPMPMRESLQLTHALVRRLGGAPRSEDIDWHGLLRLTGGNPLTIMVMVRQAVLREKVAITEQVDAFVNRVESGAAPLEPANNADLGRSESLAASLAYGFTDAFTEPERARLALLHLFRGVVNVEVLRVMGDLDVAQTDAVPVLTGADRDSLTALLDRAVELGLLTAVGVGYFGIHPALPWFFTDLFARHVRDPAAVERAYICACADLSRYMAEQLERGRTSNVLPALRVEEANLRHALRLARTHQAPDQALSCAQGLRCLFNLTGRLTEWARLVTDIQGDYIDPVTDRPRPGREDDYGQAAELGLLTDFGGGYYGIHPALPWFFTDLYTQHTPDPAAAERAYTHAYATLGNSYVENARQGQAAAVLPALRAEASNLRHALHLARAHGLPDLALACAQGLHELYDLTGRATEWAGLVDDIAGDYIDSDTDQSRPGCEDNYSIVTGYRVHIARVRRDWPTATRLQTTRTAWNQDRAAPYLDLPPGRLDPTGRHRLHTLAVSEHLLGELLSQQEDSACRPHLQAAYDLFGRIGDRPAQAVAASSLGNAHLNVPGLRNLDHAHQWHQRDLHLKPEHDRVGRAATHGSLANVAYQWFFEARAAGAPIAHLAAHLGRAHRDCQHALDLLPDDHHEYRAVAHNQLGNIYRQVRDVPRALHHFHQCIRHDEARGDIYGAGLTRYNIALLLRDNRRVGDALHYASAALVNFQQVGPGAASWLGRAQALIQELQRAAAG